MAITGTGNVPGRTMKIKIPRKICYKMGNTMVSIPGWPGPNLAGEAAVNR